MRRRPHIARPSILRYSGAFLSVSSQPDYVSRFSNCLGFTEQNGCAHSSMRHLFESILSRYRGVVGVRGKLPLSINFDGDVLTRISLEMISKVSRGRHHGVEEKLGGLRRKGYHD